jgi:hypothetical protein
MWSPLAGSAQRARAEKDGDELTSSLLSIFMPRYPIDRLVSPAASVY